MRRAFTLIELLVVIGIMGTMATVATFSFRAGRARMQLAGATRDVLALMRRARSIALITQQPTVITYANGQSEDENSIQVTLKAEKLFDDSAHAKQQVRTLSGELVLSDQAEKQERSEKVKSSSTLDESSEDGSGQSLNDVLSPEIANDIIKGLKIKVEKAEEVYLSASLDGKVYKSAISVFSTIDYVSSKYAPKKTESQSTSETKEDSSTSSADETMTEPVSVVWQTNGRTEPHTVWIYPDGSKPEKGLSITVDKFGDCQVSQWAEDEK